MGKNIKNSIKSISIDKLLPHPDNPNRMSKANFSKLVRNIEQTGRYEPLVVRPHPEKTGFFQIINGCHRYQALMQLGYKTASAIVWDIDDHQTDILLATLNRLSGSDVLDKKLALLRRLNSKIAARELAKLLPITSKQFERLINLKIPAASTSIQPGTFAEPMVFFVTFAQKQKIEKALVLATENVEQNQTRAKTRSAALTTIAERFLSVSTADEIKQYFTEHLPRHCEGAKRPYRHCEEAEGRRSNLNNDRVQN